LRVGNCYLDGGKQIRVWSCDTHREGLEEPEPVRQLGVQVTNNNRPLWQIKFSRLLSLTTSGADGRVSAAHSCTSQTYLRDAAAGSLGSQSGRVCRRAKGLFSSEPLQRADSCARSQALIVKAVALPPDETTTNCRPSGRQFAYFRGWQTSQILAATSSGLLANTRQKFVRVFTEPPELPPVVSETGVSTG
jgi:hypothetical protein